MSENKYNLPESFESSYETYKIPKVHKKLLVVSDIHVPYHSVPAITSALDYAISAKVDSVLINGDLIDQHSLSKFLVDPRKRNFKEELESTKNLLDEIQKALPVKTFLKWGNHDERYEHFLMRKAPELIGIEEYRLSNLLGTYAKGIEVIDDKRIIYAGKLAILHGHEINMKGTTVNPARTLYLKTKASCICGHLHVSSQHTEKRLDGYLVSTWSVGHLAEEHPQYAPINNWNLGFAIIDFDDEFFEVSNYKIIHGKAYRS
jgi:predicted phosphodiesterase